MLKEKPIVCHPEIGVAGRLGNVLFQYAAVKGLAKLKGSIPVLPDNINGRVWDGQPCQLQYFQITPTYVSEQRIRKVSNIFHESGCPRDFDERFLYQSPNTLLFGHYENIKYFQHIEDEIKQEFQLKEHIQQLGREKLETYRTSSETQVIGIHIRLGDYSHIYTPAYSDPTHWIHSYIETAIKQFDNIENKVFVCFTGGNKQDGQDSNDIAFVNNLLKPYIPNILISTGNPSIIDFSMLTQVNHMIILTFSTFGWWAGFLNTSPNKQIIVPKKAMFAENTEFWHSSFIQL